MPRIYDADDARWRTERFRCRQCGWMGMAQETSRHVRDGRMDLSCVRCHHVLGSVSLPIEAGRADAEPRAEVRHEPTPIDPPGVGAASALSAKATIAAVFAEQFDLWAIQLPAASLGDRSGGVIRQSGWLIRFIWGSDGAGEFLDFHASNLLGDRHHRIREDGTVEELAAPRRWLVYPPDATKEQMRAIRDEFQAHNARIVEELERKFRRAR